jgi:glycosyltransferase involved in cell wall biosynthesis
VLEAFASGCAVISTNAGGVPAILTDERHGLLVDCADHAGAAERIMRLLEDPALAERLTMEARASCAQYRWQTVRSQWLALYEGMAAGRAAMSRSADRATPAV